MLMAIDPGAVLLDTMREERVQPKRLALETGYDPGHFCRGCAGEGPLDLHRLCKADPWFLLRYFKNLTLAVTLEFFREQIGSLRMSSSAPAARDAERRA